MAKHNQNSVENKVAKAIKENNLIKADDLIVVALSGGPDSVCLFDILYNLKDKIGFSLCACHYNHRLRGEESEADQKFVEKICSERGVELIRAARGEAEIIKNEDDARKLRYAFFQKIFEERGREVVKIAIAHNLNDLAETLLLRLIRGAGLKGLSSILPQRNFFIRPLLLVSRPEVMTYLEKQHLDYRNDSSNKENKYQRNKIRNKLIPQLEKYNPHLVESLARAAISAAEDYSLLERVVEDTFNQIIERKKSGVIAILAREYRPLQASLRKNILKKAYDELMIGNDVSFEQLNKIDQIIMSGLGSKKLPLPHSLRFEVKGGIIYMYKDNSNIEENHGQSQKK